MALHEDFANLLWSQLTLLKRLHSSGDLAPLFAWMDLEGQLFVEATAYETEEAADQVSLGTVLGSFAAELEAGLAAGEIRAGAIFFHGYIAGDELHVAQLVEQDQAIMAWMKHANGAVGTIVVPFHKRRLLKGWKYENPLYLPDTSPDIVPLPVYDLPHN